MGGSASNRGNLARIALRRDDLGQAVRRRGYCLTPAVAAGAV
jgi:hypothetical protein